MVFRVQALCSELKVIAWTVLHIDDIISNLRLSATIRGNNEGTEPPVGF